MESNQLAIQIRDLRVSYTGTEDILNIKEWTIPSRTKHFLYGASGSGKSTLLSVVSGILSPSSGEVFIGGTQLNKLKSSERDRFRGENIGYIFQQFNLIPYLSVWDNINLPMVWNKDRKKRLRYPSAKEEIRYLAIQLIQTGLKSSFTGTISKTDLIVGARSGSTQLLLYSVFHIGNPTQNISYSVFKKYESHPSVSWMIPISLGDSHKGYRVVGTDERFFQHYKFRGGKSLSMQSGKWLKNNFGVVLGADIAEKLGYNLEDEITLSPGISQMSFQEHKENPFRITGILNKTFTPVDRSLYVSLDAIDIMHDVKPNPKSRQITAFLLGSRSKLQILNLQREINTSKEEPLQAVLPLIALSDIWTIVENLELVFTFHILSQG
ncbi:MAG: ATP-binding cassette domain-containing protein [Leptospira sp.]|nr:ATP-binding cassette domain-containing protein [Leptospira sp.]